MIKTKDLQIFLAVYCLLIICKNKLSIHIETGNIYYDNLNTNESIYNFILARKDDSK